MTSSEQQGPVHALLAEAQSTGPRAPAKLAVLGELMHAVLGASDDDPFFADPAACSSLLAVIISQALTPVIDSESTDDATDDLIDSCLCAVDRVLTLTPQCLARKEPAVKGQADTTNPPDRCRRLIMAIAPLITWNQRHRPAVLRCVERVLAVAANLPELWPALVVLKRLIRGLLQEALNRLNGLMVRPESVPPAPVPSSISLLNLFTSMTSRPVLLNLALSILASCLDAAATAPWAYSSADVFSMAMSLDQLWHHLSVFLADTESTRSSEAAASKEMLSLLYLTACTKGIQLSSAQHLEEWVPKFRDASMHWLVEYSDVAARAHPASEFDSTCAYVILSSLLEALRASSIAPSQLSSSLPIVASALDRARFTTPSSTSVACGYLSKVAAGIPNIDGDNFADNTLEGFRLEIVKLHSQRKDTLHDRLVDDISEPASFATLPSQDLFAFAFSSLPFWMDAAPSSMKELNLWIGYSISEIDTAAKHELIVDIGRLACILGGSYDPKLKICRLCDSSGTSISPSRAEYRGFAEALTKIINADNFQEHPQLRLECLRTLKRILSSFQPEFAFDWSSDLSTWLIACLKSTIREIRIAVISLLPYFVVVSDVDIRERNAGHIFRALSNVNLKADEYLLETTLLAWGRVGSVVSGDFLNLVLIKLISFLNSESSYHSSLAFHELKSIARAKNSTCYQLCTPFWSTISVSVVKQMTPSSPILARFSDLIGISTTDFLVRTTSFTLPYLILARNNDAVKALAAANMDTVGRVCFTRAAVILAVLLTQKVDNPEEFARARWLEIDPSYSASARFEPTVRSNFLDVTFELLKLYQKDDEGKADRIRHGLQLVGSLRYGMDPGPDSLKHLFNGSNVLHLVTKFSDTVRNVAGVKPYTVKLQCLRGISMMIQCSGSEFSIAVPQICAQLQSALDTPELQKCSLEAWYVMVDHVRDISTILDLTFAVVVQIWPSLESEAKEVAHDLVKHLLIDKSSEVAAATRNRDKTVRVLPSLRSVPELEDCADLVDKLQSSRHPYFRLKCLVDRSRNENVHMVRQTVLEMCDFFLSEQDAFSFGSDRSTSDIRGVVRSLFNIMFTFRSSETDILQLGARCMGLIGAVDSHKIDIMPEKTELVMVNNFSDYNECVDFVVYLVDQLMAKTFKASTDPAIQLFLAYGIQEYLKFCKLTQNGESAQEKSITNSKVWKKFSEESRSLLAPLLFSKYTSPETPLSRMRSPIFDSKISYQRWLQVFTYCLMSSVSGSYAEQIFGICRRVVRDREHYEQIYEFILPYAALNVMLCGTESNRNAILDEILLILNTSSQLYYDIGQLQERVFSILDYFSKWMREVAKSNSNARRTRPSARAKQDTSLISSFLSQISPALMAQRSFDCKSYPRAIMYWEQHLKMLGSSPPEESSKPIYAKFQEIYASIDDPDALDGISAMLPDLTTRQQILQYENTGRWHEALECYEVLRNSNDQWDLSTDLKLMNCLKQSGRYDDLLARLDMDAAGMSNVPEDYVTMGVEVSWLSERWESLDRWLAKSVKDSYESNMGGALLALKNRNFEELEYRITRARANVASTLSLNYVTSLSQCGDSLVRLHALADLESIGSVAQNGGDIPHKAFSSRLDSHLAAVGMNFDARRYLLALRRAAISISGLDFAKAELGVIWMFSAGDARAQEQSSLALRASMQAMQSGNPLAKVEYARLLWDQGEQRKAVTTLESVLHPKFIAESDSLKSAKDFTRSSAEVALLYTKWISQSDLADSATVVAKFAAIAQASQTWDEAYYLLAKYYNRLYDYHASLPVNMRDASFNNGSYVLHMVNNYCRTLQYGTAYIYESLPKVITLWLDFATNMMKLEPALKSQENLLDHRTKVLASVNDFLSKMATRIPAYVFYLALPQLLSRIVVSDKATAEVLELLIVEICKAYPQRAFWYILPLANSKKRAARGHELLKRLDRAMSGGRARLARELRPPAESLIRALTDFCNASPTSDRPILDLERDFKFDKSVIPCQLVVPVQSLMDITLPATAETMKHHDPFPQGSHTIMMIDDAVSVQRSLQRPKRIHIWGSNGRGYKILCKARDDVRKDARLLEFTSSIHKLLQRDSKASLRRLGISTYLVIPLKEDCGLIEWVDHSIPMRAIITKSYAAKAMEVTISEAKALLFNKPEAEQLKNFRTLTQKYTPVLWEWFIDTFPDPGAWLASRTNYARSCAVMSMVGYILGLGDRHGENLLFLESTGGILHVDFDCLFDKALGLEVPERVPFRLTPNMVDAFGLSGCEGTFRRSSEVTLALLRDHESMLMTVLEAFLHDPIVEWSRKRAPLIVINGLSPARNPEEALTTIRRKIRGMRGASSIPLSVSGQVEYLIQQAVSPQNLSKMYPGWLPHV